MNVVDDIPCIFVRSIHMQQRMKRELNHFRMFLRISEKSLQSNPRFLPLINIIFQLLPTPHILVLQPKSVPSPAAVPSSTHYSIV